MLVFFIIVIDSKFADTSDWNGLISNGATNILKHVSLLFIARETVIVQYSSLLYAKSQAEIVHDMQSIPCICMCTKRFQKEVVRWLLQSDLFSSDSGSIVFCDSLEMYTIWLKRKISTSHSMITNRIDWKLVELEENYSQTNLEEIHVQLEIYIYLYIERVFSCFTPKKK